MLSVAACTENLTAPGLPRRGGVVGVSMSPSLLDLAPGDTARLRASVAADSGVTATIIWKTSDSTIAVVSSDGLVAARAAGTAAITVTATFSGNSASASATVTVHAPASVASDVMPEKTSSRPAGRWVEAVPRA